MGPDPNIRTFFIVSLIPTPQGLMSFPKRSKTQVVSQGPGLASGWN
jgi:hypothetical protein